MPANNPRGNPATLTSFSAKWQSGSTQVIRVPIALADQILDLAHQLDQGLPIEVAKPASQSLLQAIEKLNQVAETPRNNFPRERRELLRSAIADLRALVTVNKQ